MPDSEIPPELIAAQRRFDAAHAAVVAAARAGEPLDGLMAEERAAAVEAHRLRAGTPSTGTPWETWEQQKRIREAAQEAA